MPCPIAARQLKTVQLNRNDNGKTARNRGLHAKESEDVCIRVIGWRANMKR